MRPHPQGDPLPARAKRVTDVPEITAIQLPPQTTPIPLQSVLDVRWGGATTDRMSICGASVVADLRVAMDPRSRAAIRLLEACIYPGASSIHIAKRVDELSLIHI